MLDDIRGDDLLSRLLIQARRAHEIYRPTVDPAAALAARREVGVFLEDYRDTIHQKSASRLAVLAAAPPAPEQAPIFSYWDSPLDDAPPLVRACRAQLLAVHPEVHILDRNTVSDWVDIPPLVAERLADRPAHFSDYLRVSLLEQYGGMWVDATCFVPRPLTETVPELLTAGMLYLRWAGTQISNWFIAAERGNPVVSLQRATLETWWEENGTLPDYFLYHRFFEGLHATEPVVKETWKAMPKVSTLPSHLLQLTMFRPYEEQELALILRASFIQKLSYKYDPDSVLPGSNLERLLDGTLVPSPVA
jgi:hypothetical protein